MNDPNQTKSSKVSEANHSTSSKVSSSELSEAKWPSGAGTLMYVCGPTTYDHSHIGHARTYMVVDIYNRVMTNILNKKTFLVLNITDIDDKIINKATAEKVNWKTISEKYESLFFESMCKLNIKLPNSIIHVTDMIPQIVCYIQKIM